MGALHEGHLSLVRAARASSDVVAASIFVNPTQFGPNEDLAKYPRSFERDRELLEREGVELLFAPPVEEMYPAGDKSVRPTLDQNLADKSVRATQDQNLADKSVRPTQDQNLADKSVRPTLDQNLVTWVTVEGLSGKLDGRSRPGHFRGVTTVVAKLFHIVEPDAAFFGQKDAAQVAIIRRMVRDLNLAVEIVVCPIVREADGLAMSSRNAYLDAEQRKRALVLHRSLLRVQELADAGERDAVRLRAAGLEEFAREDAVRLDYFEIVDPDTLDSVETVAGGALVAIAAVVGSTRLIDNVLFGGRTTPK